VAVAEALSWTGLLIGMVFKYLVVGNAIGVHVFGPIHGVLFLLYLVVTWKVRRQLRWSTPVTVAAFLASIPPLCTLIFERWATRTGRLREDSSPHRLPRANTSGNARSRGRVVGLAAARPGGAVDPHGGDPARAMRLPTATQPVEPLPTRIVGPGYTVTSDLWTVPDLVDTRS
jgi:integral membrane protein